MQSILFKEHRGLVNPFIKNISILYSLCKASFCKQVLPRNDIIGSYIPFVVIQCNIFVACINLNRPGTVRISIVDASCICRIPNFLYYRMIKSCIFVVWQTRVGNDIVVRFLRILHIILKIGSVNINCLYLIRKEEIISDTKTCILYFRFHIRADFNHGIRLNFRFGLILDVGFDERLDFSRNSSSTNIPISAFGNVYHILSGDIYLGISITSANRDTFPHRRSYSLHILLARLDKYIIVIRRKNVFNFFIIINYISIYNEVMDFLI